MWCGFFLSACVTTHERGQLIRSESLKSDTCTIHHIPLETTTRYMLGKGTCILYERYVYRPYKHYPNAFPLNSSSEKSSFFSVKDENVRICRICDSKLSAYQKRHNN